MATSRQQDVVKQSLPASLLTGRPWRIAAASAATLAAVTVGAKLLYPQPLVRSSNVTLTVAVLGGAGTAVYWGYLARSIAVFAAVATALATAGAATVGESVLDAVGVTGTLLVTSVAVTFPAWLLLGLVAGLTARWEFEQDRAYYTSAVPYYPTHEIPYEEVEVVIRSRDLGDRLFGAASYELVRSKEPNVSAPSIADPDAFERRLNAEVTEPSRQIEASHRFNNQFWYLWPEYTDAPPEPVVDEDDLSGRLDADVDDLALNRLDAACESDVDDLHEVDGDFKVPDAGGGDGFTASDADGDADGGDGGDGGADGGDGGGFDGGDGGGFDGGFDGGIDF